MRPVSLSDSELILMWRNSASAANVSQLGREISQSEHQEWFSSRVSRISSEPFWIMASDGKCVGFVRLDLADNFYNIFTVSIFVDPEFRKLGVGKQMLGLSLGSVTTDNMGHDFRAVIRKDNFGSIKLFKLFGFEFFVELDENFHEYRRIFKSDALNL